MTPAQRLDTVPILQAGAPVDQAAGALILLHGRGGNAQEMLALGRDLTNNRLALLAPQAPDHTWYPFSFLAPRQQNEPFLSSSLRVVEQALADAMNAGLKPSQVAFCGFSQGACLATEFVARHPQRYAALLAFTGGLIGPLAEPISLTGDLDGTPVLLSSGDPDPHVPWARVRQSGELLTGIGATLTLQRHPGRPHTVLPEEIAKGKELLFELLSASRPSLPAE